MSEIVELKTFFNEPQKENAIEEYHEIENRKVTQKPAKVVKKPNEFYFLTQLDVSTSKKSTKKKKFKKKQQTNIMDIITSELAAHESPIVENVITPADPSINVQLMYLQKTPRILDRFQRNWQWRRDTEWGTNFGANLKPVFSKENFSNENDKVKPYYVKPKMFDDMVASSDNFSSDHARFLDIELRNLKFKHHHNFGIEKLLAIKLNEIITEYQKITESVNNIERLIKVNRDTKENLKAELLKISSPESVRLDPTVRKYTGQLLQLKSTYMEELKKRGEILNNVLSLWSDITLVREKTNTITTPYIIDVSSKEMDDDEKDKEWQVTFNTEFKDLLDREEYDYISKYLDYKRQKYELKAENKKSKLLKPKLDINEAYLREEAEKITNQMLGINTMLVDLRVDDKLKAKLIKKETDAVIFNYYFKVYVDDAFVCESELYSSKTFEFRVHESLSVQIMPHNIFMTIILYENNSQISSLKISLKEIKKNYLQADYDKVELTTNAEIPATNKQVGSGNTIKDIASANKLRLKSVNFFKGKMYTTCETNMKIGWNDHINHTNHESIITFKDTERQICRILSGLDEPRFDNLKELIEKVHDKDLDKDEDIVAKIEALCRQRVETDENFPVDESSSDFIRLKLLHLRNKGDFSEIDDKLVPLYPSQISTEQLNCLQKSNLQLGVNNLKGDKYSEMDPIELQRYIGAKYVEGLNKTMLKNLKETLMRKSYRDVVMDFQDFSLRDLFPTQSPSYNGGRNNIDTEVEIFVTVFRAFNLPERTSPILPDEAGDGVDTIAGFKLRSLRPFVKLYYQGSSTQSAAAIGCHPTWNQTLKIKANHSQPSSLHINIFDEQRVTLTEQSEDSYQGTMQIRCHNNWLGCLSVPLQSVLAIGKLRGTFNINTPPLLLGYQNVTKEKESQSFIPQMTQLLRKESSFIALQITTNRPSPTNHFVPLPNDPDDYVTKHLNAFLGEYQNEFPSRNFHLTFIDSGGKNRCVTQFLQPIALPDFVLRSAKRSDSAKSSNTRSSSSKSLDMKRNVDVEKGLGTDVESLYSAYERGSKVDDLEKMINCALRYVSLIPTYDVNEEHVVTLMGVELLKVLHGSALDHTILLASYFLYLGLKTYVVVGLGLPRGPSSYVLTKYDSRTRNMVLNGQTNDRAGFMNRNDGFVWNLYDAVKGERFELRDVSCPLKTVDYIFDNDNVFDKTIYVMKQPILTDANLYKAPLDTEQLRNALENRIRTKIQKWRSHNKTIWNRYCGTVLREAIPQWEHRSFCPGESRPGLGHRLRQMMLTYKVYGFPLNIPYANAKSVISAVKSTGIHVNDDPNAEFGLAVEVYGYPNNVLSVWVFLASIVRI